LQVLRLKYLKPEGSTDFITRAACKLKWHYSKLF
jgi:hypothetical protein